MRTLHKRFNELRNTYAVSWDLIEQDYLLSWVLAGIAATPELHSILVFKGGTALKKAYFGEYRFSQDLDFTACTSLPDDKTLVSLMNEACERAIDLQSIQSSPVYIKSQRYAEKRPHPHNQKAFSIFGHFPWQREPLTRVMVGDNYSRKVDHAASS